MTYISWFSDFALYLEYLLDKCHTWDISSMWPNEWPLTISRSLWPIFHASVILPFIFITISWRIVIPGLLYLCDKMIYIQIHLGQWYCNFYTQPHDSGGVLWYHIVGPCVCQSACQSVVCSSVVLFPVTISWVNVWIFTKLGMCIDIEIWFGIANGQILSIFDNYLPAT